MPNIRRMASVTCDGTRLEQLQTLALVLAESIDDGDESHSMAQLARQYRETIREIAELEGEDDNSDAISQLIAKRNADG
jgi:hypothetical protein